MEELEISPQGVSPEPEPAPPVETEGGGRRGTGQDACPTVKEVLASSLFPFDDTPAPISLEDSQIKAILEAIVYVAEEPLTLAQIAASLQQPPERIKDLLDQ